MLGPQILARTMSKPTKKGKGAQAWQYHSRSDSHSKAACWTVLFDLMRECPVFLEHANTGKVGFAVNHVMVGKLNKTLDLVICAVPPTRPHSKRRSFADLVKVYNIQLTDEEAKQLANLPSLLEENSGDISEVLIALEAKACMTEHGKSIPRLHAEILATGFLAKQAAPTCITASYTLVNAAPSFISPGSKREINNHNQPADAKAVVKMLGQAIPDAGSFPKMGYDVIGVTVVECRNDGSTVGLVTGDPAPQTSDYFHYDRMMRSLCSVYRDRFSQL